MLNQYVEDNLNNPKILLNLAEQIKLISRRLNQLKMSHGDLQHGNILISSQGKPVLIDYDGMYTPNMSYNKSNEVGHLNFQHPQRNSAFFNEKIDRFSTIVLYLSLHCLASPYGRQLWQSYHTGENLIFSRKDYENPGASQLFAELRKNLTVAPLVKNFERLCAYQIDKIPCLEDFLNPNRIIIPQVNKVIQTTHSQVIYQATNIKSLIQKEGEIITVVGKVTQVHEHKIFQNNKTMCFINFGRPGKVFKDYTSFAIVIFAEGLYKLQKLKGFSLDDLKSLAGKHIEITGLLGIYPNVNKDCLVPEIILDNPYTLRIIDENERQVLPTGTPISTTSVMLPTAESKPVPPSVRTTNTINRTSTPTSTNLPSKPKPPTPNVPTTNIPSVPVNSSVNNPPPSVNSSTPNTPPPPSPPEDTGNGAGTITGIFIGAAIGGPVGAVVGGVAGALVGNWLRSLGKK